MLLAASLFAEATFEQVQSMIEKQQYKQATLALTIIAENHPNSSKVLYTLAQAQAGLGDLVKARENLDKAMAINPRLDFVPAEQVVQLQKALQPQTKLITKVEEPSHWFRNLFIAFIAGFLAIIGYKKFFKKEEKPTVSTPPTGSSSVPSNSTSSTPSSFSSSKTMYGPTTPSARNYYYEQATQPVVQPTSTVTEVHHHHHSDSGIGTVGAGVVGLVTGAAIAESLHDNHRSSSSWADTSYEEPRSTRSSSSSSTYSPSWDASSSSSSSSRSWDDSSSSSSRSKSWDDNSSSSSSSWSSSSDSSSSSSWD